MEARRGKLNLTVWWFGSPQRVAMNKNPNRVRGRGFSFSPRGLLPYTSLRFAPAMIVRPARRLIKSLHF